MSAKVTREHCSAVLGKLKRAAQDVQQQRLALCCVHYPHLHLPAVRIYLAYLI